MGPNHGKNIRLKVKLGIAMLLGVSATAQDVKLNVTYVCNGEPIYDTNETRCTLKNLFPTCQRPTRYNN